MASFSTAHFPFTVLFLFLTISTQTHVSISTRDVINVALNSTDIHQLLSQYGFPKGLLPNNVKSYALSDRDGTFEIQLQTDCYVNFDMLVYYDKKIKGRLSYGSVADVSGIQAKKLFVWVSVTAIKANHSSETIDFYAGFLSETLPARRFDNIPACTRKPCLQEETPQAM